MFGMKDLVFLTNQQKNVKYLWIGIIKMIKNSILPGLGLSICIALIGFYFSDFVGIEIMGFKKSPISSIMLAIILGFILGNTINFSNLFNSGSGIFLPGIDFGVKTILRLGIVCLGIRLGLGDIFKLGTSALPIIAICLISALIIVTYLSKKLNISSRMAILIAVGTSICGTSAIVATAPVIDANKEEATYAIANITVFGILAMFLYPFFANYLFSGNEYAAGLFIGTSIHETAQVAGAGLIYADQFNSEVVLDVSTVTKLARNTCMIIIIPIMAFIYHRNSKLNSKNKKIEILNIFPLFIFGFIAMGLFRTLGDISIQSYGFGYGYIEPKLWFEIVEFIKKTAELLLTVAMASLGLSTNIRSISKLGVKPFYLGFASALSVGVVSFISITLIIV
tara:strand:+ start:67 stop:1251 length:1185 start_codon:yes stop_codon:yes gene_type:complete